MVKMPDGFEGLYIATTVTRPKSSTPCSTTSTWPRCSGSKLPGYNTLVTDEFIAAYGNRSRVVMTVRPYLLARSVTQPASGSIS